MNLTYYTLSHNGTAHETFASLALAIIRAQQLSMVTGTRCEAVAEASDENGCGEIIESISFEQGEEVE